MPYPTPIPAARVWLTVPEAAALTGVSAYCFRHRIKKGALEAWAPTPRSTKVPLDALVQFMPPDVRARLPEVLTGNAARDAVAGLLHTVAEPVAV